MNTVSKLFCTMLLSASVASVFAEPQSYLALDNGYRWDRLTNRATVGGPTLSTRGASQQLKSIQSYQLGGRGQVAFDEHTFIRATGHYGWVFDGEYLESAYHGDLKGRTWDVSGAVGYYLTVYKKETKHEVEEQKEVVYSEKKEKRYEKDKHSAGFWIAPLVGWSYDVLNLTGTDLEMSFNGEEFEDLNHINAKQTFNGPYAGFDFLFQLYPKLDFIFGYEFHYASWHGKRVIKGDDYGTPSIFGIVTGYSNTRHIRGVIGSVFKLNTSYNFWDMWKAGLELQYKLYAGDHGCFKQTKTPINPLVSYKKVDGLWWTSFGVTLYLGGVF